MKQVEYNPKVMDIVIDGVKDYTKNWAEAGSFNASDPIAV
jgi:hypothetical protein